MRPFKKYVNCIIAFFIPFYSTCVILCQFHSIAPSSFPELFTKINKLWSERKQDFLYIWLLFVSRYIKEGRKSHLWTKPHLCINNTHVCINNPYCQSSVIIIFLANIIYSQKHWPAYGCVFLVTCCNIIIRPSWETKKEGLNHRKKYIEESLFRLQTLLPVIFCLFFGLLPPFPLPRFFFTLKKCCGMREGTPAPSL